MCGPTAETFSPAGPGMETINVTENESTSKAENQKLNSESTPPGEGNFEKKLVEVNIWFDIYINLNKTKYIK